MTRRPLASVVLGFASVALGFAVAAAPSRVVLIRSGGADALTRQAETLLAGELRAAAFEVVPVDHKPGVDLRAEIESSSADLRPIATLAILPVSTGAGVEVWLSDRMTGKLVIRRVNTNESADGNAAADLALRAVELLRGSLLEIVVARTDARASQKPPPPADVARFVGAKEEPAARRYATTGVGVIVGGAVLHSATGFGPGFAPTVRLGWGSAGGFAVRAGFVAPGTEATVEAREGSARIRQDLIAIEALQVFRPLALFQPYAIIGLGMHRLSAVGTGVSPLFPGHTGSAVGAAGSVGGGVLLRLGSHALIYAEAQGVLSLPPAAVTIADQEVARAGGLSILGSLGAGTTF